MIGRNTTWKEHYEITNDYRKDKTILESGLSAVLTHYQQLLPFYLFLTLFVLYIILLAFTGKLKQVFKDLTQHPFLLAFIGFSFIVSMVAGNYVGAVISVGFVMYAIFFKYYQRRLTPDFFHIVLQTVLLPQHFRRGICVLRTLWNRS